jgi:lipid II isoglutaminyl synthase (glutamine-hydrolysing)
MFFSCTLESSGEKKLRQIGSHQLMNAEKRLRIAHLYAHFLNIYGDRGNLLTLVKRCQWRNIDVEVRATGLEEKIDPDYFDVFFIGGGQDKQQQVIAEDLYAGRSALSAAIEGGAVILSICGGYQLLGHYYRPHVGPELPGISLVDAWTVAGHRRMIGNVVVRRESGQTLVGFENHSGRTYLGKGVAPLGKVITGNGNNGEDGMEGLAQPVGKGMVYGTYLHGSLLPKNPALADEIIRVGLSRRHGKVSLDPLDDGVEKRAHQYALSLRA